MKEHLLKALEPFEIYKNAFTKEEFVSACIAGGRLNKTLGLSVSRFTNITKKTFPNKPKQTAFMNYLLFTLNKKLCNKCKTIKDYSEFHKNKSNKDNLSSSCATCRCKEQADYYSCNREAQISRVRKREENLDRSLTQKEINYIFERDNYECCSCKYENEQHIVDFGQNLHLDHITPISKGGLTVIENIQLLCRSCNSSKGNSL